MISFQKDIQYYKFCIYGFLKNLRFFEPFLILFFLQKDITYIQIGTLYAIREIFRNIFEIPSGILADSIGRKKSMVISILSYIVSFMLFFISNSYSVFFGAMVFYAFGDAFRTGTHKAMIFEYLKMNNWSDLKAQYYGHTRSWSQFGSAISAIIAALIVFYSGNINTVFLFSVIPYLLDLLLIISYPDALNGELNTTVDHNKILFRFQFILRGFILTFKKREMIRNVTNFALHSGYFRSVKDYLQPILKTIALGLPVLTYLDGNKRAALIIGITYTIIYFLTSFSSRLSGRLASHFKDPSLPLNISMVFGFAFLLLAGFFYVKEFPILASIFFMMIFMIENLRNPLGVALVSDIPDEKFMATMLSASSQMKSLFAAITSILLGFFADQFGPGVSIMVVSSMLVLLSPLYWISKKQKLKMR